MKILFICTGNICRSPLAEAVLRYKAALAGKTDAFIIDSAGTHDYHEGEHPDPRTLKIAALNNVPTDGIRARKVRKDDFQSFDLILGMDSGHVRLLKEASPDQYHPKIHLFQEFAGRGVSDIADPYYGNFQDFSICYDEIEVATERILKKLMDLD